MRIEEIVGGAGGLMRGDPEGLRDEGQRLLYVEGIKGYYERILRAKGEG